MKCAITGSLAVLLSLSAASAGVISGNTTGAPTFNRPVQGLDALSAVGTANPYVVIPFTVSAADFTRFTLTADTPGFDTFLLLYSSFDPLNPLANALVADDDISSGDTNSQVDFLNLNPGDVYFAVVTGFDPNDFGAFTLTGGAAPGADGPVEVTFIPAPGAAGVLAGAGLLALRRRRHGVR